MKRLLLLAAAAAAPFVFPTIAQRHLLILIAINVILVASLDLLMGTAGLLSLGHAGFMGIGAYTSALLALHYRIPFLLALAAAALAGGLAGLFIGYPSLRLRHHYFVLVTFIFGIILTLLFTSLVGVTRGPMGLPGIPFATIGLPQVGAHTFNTFRSKVDYYYLVAGAAGGVLWLRGRLVRGRLGAALIAIREEEQLAMAVGIPTHRYKVLAFVISTAIAGAAGSLYAHYATFISPEVFTFVDSFNLFVMNMIGGAGTPAGPVVGPLLLTVVRDTLRNISPVAAEIAFGAFLIAAIAFLPTGLMGALRRSAGRGR
ncbi:MAG: branched-chain amino acid ABC transporter permease [Armatimonadota bacterium]|nr:branched-chain amino acid ABC transporter permease [Armatimonadota bacterium]MDR7452128.1 branched-chain amino acid ABC transporter permease [Armatimonadota bacterium]MDR7467852.1 branched-chain amino acid ABC transporter permease [Armatimonadota bacterium]MDR7494740.1 branched-chain amino acid ABC transporter permease [Armatimonadota bacterium]MDR7499565.1 branched-chain amino acid ABC transporter permease [Armatimonadota bacterium]